MYEVKIFWMGKNTITCIGVTKEKQPTFEDGWKNIEHKDEKNPLLKPEYSDHKIWINKSQPNKVITVREIPPRPE